MSNINLAVNRVAAGPPSTRTCRILGSCLMFLLLAYLPAYADHIHHLWYNNSLWQDQDLTVLTHGGISESLGAIAAFYTTPNHQFHVYYVDITSQHVHQLYNNGKSWSDEDLSALTGGPTAYAYGITGFSIGNLQYVFYVAIDSHVHELNYNNASWVDQDLTGLLGGNSASPAPLVAFATKPNNQLHVYYQDANNLHEYQLYYNGASWSYQDLTSITGTGTAFCYTQWMAAFAMGNQQHLFCPGYLTSTSNLDLLHFSYTSAWSVEDITLQASRTQTPMYLDTGVAAFRVPVFPQWEVWGVTADTHLNEYIGDYQMHTWVDWDATTTWGAPSDAHYGGIVAFVTTPNNQQHIYYAPSTDVYQFYFNGTAWTVENLTGGSGQADDNSGMAGFALGNAQHVFYMSYGN